MLVRGVLYSLVFVLGVTVCAKVRLRAVRQWVLLIGSYALYLSWGSWFAGVLLFSTLMNYLLGKWLQREPSRLALSVGILLNLALLGSFKYLPEVSVTLPLSSLQRFAHLALPLGISFWTFQAMSYLFDQYRGEELDPTFVEFALYMAFFPVTISGPICRMPEMLPQFRSESALAWSDIERGFGRIATGVLMMQLAKLLGQGILAGDSITSGFDRLAHWTGPDVWCLAFGFGLQLFFDFAGFTHIAIGAVKVLGFTVPENFARPFQSITPSIFWTRWHMSLSFWIRDYVFFPMATLRREVWWRNLVLVFSMVVFGLWHNTTWLFVIWGCYHGLLLVGHRLVQQLERRFDWDPQLAFWTPLSWIVTITLISLGWIFFRASSLAKAGQMLSAVLSPATYGNHLVSGSLYLLVLALGLGYMIVLVVIDVLDRYPAAADAHESNAGSGIMAFLARKRWFWVPPLYALTLLLVLAVTLTQGPATSQLMYRAF